MSKLYFIYSSMNAGKSAQMLMRIHNHEEQGKKVALLTHEKDTRSKKGFVQSRLNNIERKADLIVSETTNILNFIEQEMPYAVFVDEGQFFTKEQVLQLAEIVDQYKIPVIVYGLKNDFRNELFEGSYYLLVYADKIEEIRTGCKFCLNKATAVLRVDENGKPVYTGKQIQPGGNDSYIQVCRYCHKNPKLDDEGKVDIDNKCNNKINISKIIKN